MIPNRKREIKNMYIVTYSKELLTFKADTKEEAEELLARCEAHQDENYGLSPDDAESSPQLMTEKEYLEAICEDSIEGIKFDDQNAVGMP